MENKHTTLPFITPQIVVEAIRNEETIEFMNAVPTMEDTEDNAINFMEFLKYTEKSDEELELGIFDVNTNKFIGMCTLENINREYSVCELGYWLDKSYVGKGHMTECVKVIIEYAKTELHMKSVRCICYNRTSKIYCIIERLGFVRKELLKNDTENKGKEVDRVMNLNLAER